MHRLLRLPVLLAAVAAFASLGLAACGTQEIEIAADDPNRRGAELFNARCAGCHTLDASGSQGSSSDVHDRERVDGPNFNERIQDVKSVLYAIRNGGFSGAIMPANLLTGQEAEQVAEFLAKYSGANVDRPASSPQPVG